MALNNIPRTCQNCQKQFFTSLGVINATPVKYCSQKCYYKGRTRPLSERFWEKVEKTETCWLWTGARVPSGYGLTGIGRKNIRAHRASYELAYGPIPDGMFVCHKCDNPPCVRPDHLFLGTPADNTHDKINKGRAIHKAAPFANRNHGTKSTFAKLTDEQVKEIRELRKTMMVKDIARQFGVVRTTISNICKGHTWKHLS